MKVRFALEGDLGQVNELRKEVNRLHVEGRPDIFKAGFPDVVADYVYEIFRDPVKNIIVAEDEGTVCGFAVIQYVNRGASPYCYARSFVDIDELCVAADHRRKGIATEMINFVRETAMNKGYDKIELNMWEFNSEALEFYEKVGFKTYRRYMEMKL